MPIDSDTLASLIERIADQRDRAAFARLFGWFAPRVKGHMQRLGSAPTLAEHQAVEVMTAVWRCADRFDRRQTSAEAWIFRIARNLNLDSFRRDEAPRLGRLPGRMPTLAGLAPERAGMAL
jgi:RNA polymerase sigma-70 factor (ECF subfamily)